MPIAPTPPTCVTCSVISTHGALPDKADGTIRLVILSDTHGTHWHLPTLPPGDALLHLGDVADKGNLEHIRSFTQWLQTQQPYYKDIVVIEGNHDRNLRQPEQIDLRYEYRQVLGDTNNKDRGKVHFLQDEAVVLQGAKKNQQLRLYGASWDSCELNQFSVSKDILPFFPDGRIDMLLTHVGPGMMPSGQRICPLYKLVRNLRVPCHVFGHIHRRRGVSIGKDTVSINCATSPTGLPVVVDYCPKLRRVLMVYCPWEEHDCEDIRDTLV